MEFQLGAFKALKGENRHFSTDFMTLALIDAAASGQEIKTKAAMTGTVIGQNSTL